jgi:2-polyprenyl-3-methyl-5-hydroxy-6-metoxy-1,4-benzoquinol methylase
MAEGQSDGPADSEQPVAAFDRAFWDRRWSDVFRDNAEQVAQRAPNTYLTAAAGDLAPGRALDAGCGNGTEALWLAARGWHVTAVDFSAAALDYGRSAAAMLGQDIAERIAWVEGDLGAWTPEAGCYELVTSLYVHVSGSVEDMVERLATGVAPGGTMLLVGHLPIDPATGVETPAAGQVQVTLEAAVAVLDVAHWELSIAERRPRAVAGSGVDAVICARRLA